jgi:hypothetical protein
MTIYSFWGAVVAVMVAIIAVRAFLYPAKTTVMNERKTLQPFGEQDSMIGNEAWTSHDSSGGSDAQGS